MQYVSARTSTRTGTAPIMRMAAAVAPAVWDTVTTSSPRADPCRQQAEHQRLGAAADPDGAGYAKPGREFAFERTQLLSQNIGAGIQHPRNGSENADRGAPTIAVRIGKGNMRFGH